MAHMSSGEKSEKEKLRDDVLDWTFAALLAALVCGIVAARASVAPTPSRLAPIAPVPVITR